MISFAQPETWVDTLKAAAPIIISALVVLMQYRQNQWQKRVTDRQASADRQKFQLTSMEKRLDVIHALTTLLGKLSFGQDDAEARALFFQSLIAGQLLFDSTIAKRLDDAWTLQIRWLSAYIPPANRLPTSAGTADREERASVLLEELVKTLIQLRADMISNSRIVVPEQ